MAQSTPTIVCAEPLSDACRSIFRKSATPGGRPQFKVLSVRQEDCAEGPEVEVTMEVSNADAEPIVDAVALMRVETEASLAGRLTSAFFATGPFDKLVPGETQTCVTRFRTGDAVLGVWIFNALTTSPATVTKSAAA